jgi:hypothetical protein
MAKILTLMLGAWMALTFGLITALAGSSSDTSESGDRVVTGEPAAVASTGMPVEHTERHARMTKQMRVSTPDARMQARMADDPMWQMMYDPAHIRAEEEYQRQVDRMLARTP